MEMRWKGYVFVKICIPCIRFVGDSSFRDKLLHQSMVLRTSGMAAKLFLVSKMSDYYPRQMFLVFGVAGFGGRS